MTHIANDMTDPEGDAGSEPVPSRDATYSRRAFLAYDAIIVNGRAFAGSEDAHRLDEMLTFAQWNAEQPQAPSVRRPPSQRSGSHDDLGPWSDAFKKHQQLDH